MCNLKYSIPKGIPTVFHNGFYYDCHFFIKELAEEFDKQFTCLGENTENYINFYFQYKKRLQELIIKERKLQNTCPTDYNLLIVQNLWEAYNQVLLIIMLKEFIKLNVNTNTMIKKCETWGIKYKYWGCVIENTSFKDGLVEY